VEELDRTVAALAAGNHSLFTLADVLRAGGTRAHAHTRVRAGRWDNPWSGVYRIVLVAVSTMATVHMKHKRTSLKVIVNFFIWLLFFISNSNTTKNSLVTAM
jgi:hypothetical protein